MIVCNLIKRPLDANSFYYDTNLEVVRTPPLKDNLFYVDMNFEIF